MLAAALGCPFEQVLGLAGCGFDLIFDSSRWWDLRARWFLEQREELRPDRAHGRISRGSHHGAPGGGSRPG